MSIPSLLRTSACVAAVVLLAAGAGRGADDAAHGAAAHGTGEHGTAEHGAGEHGAGEHGAGEHGAGGIKSDLPFWGIVAFVGFLFAIKKLGWDSLTSGMRDREANENRLIAEAEQLRTRTAEQLRHNKGKMESLDELVRHTLAEAERDADHTRKDIRVAAEKEAALSRQRAEAEINRVQTQSLSDLFAAAADRIAEQAEARIRQSLSAADQQKLIDAAVGEFASQKA